MPTRLLIVLCMLAAVFLTPIASAQSKSERQGVADTVGIELRSAWETLEASGDFKRAEAEMRRILDLVIAYAGDEQDDLFEDAAFALRLVRQLPAAGEAQALERLRYLRAPGNDALARTLAFLVDEERDDLPGVYGTLDKLRKAQDKKDRLGEFATLAAAICVVHDGAGVRQTHEDITRAASPAELWKFYTSNERRMYFGVKNVPGQLLVYVVDNHASPAELEWALSNYAGDRAIGRQFFNIAYDYEHFLGGKDKKVLEKGYTLPNIRQYGGVCADQAYFAVTVGKSIGVPAVYTVGQGTSTSHAWVGYLERKGKAGAWNFEEGRYEEYKNVRGSTLDPQTRRMVSDSDVAVLAEMIGASPEDVRRASALLEAARRMDELSGAKDYPPAPPAGLDGLSAREATVAAQLDLIERSLRRCPGYTNAWHRVAEMAGARRLTLADKQRWAGVLDRLCEGRYPEFTVDILTPMIHTIEDIEDRNTFWDRLAKTCGRRKDLIAQCKVEQGQMWERAGEKARAYDCYKLVIDTYINDGPFALTALARAESMLVEEQRGDVLLQLYAHAFARTTKPDFAAVFATQSNWFKIGSRYVYWLERDGDKRAQNIKMQLEGIRNAQ